MYQLEGRNHEGAPWVRYPIIFTERDEAVRAFERLETTRVSGWPEFRIVRVAAEQEGSERSS